MADLTKLIKISVETGKSEVEINGVKHAIDDLIAAERQLNQTLISAAAGRKRTQQTIESEIRTLQFQRKAVADTTIQYGRFTAEIKQLEMELAVLRGTAVRTSDGVNQLRNSSGLASQTLVEVGRTISDANYGFTAVANNLSQLSYYFIALVKDSKGVGNAFRDLGKQLLGAGGIIIALQLVITVIEKFTLKQQEAERAIKKTTNALAGAEGQIAKLEQYADILKDSTASTESQEFALKKLKKEGYDKTIGSIEKFIEAKKALLLFEANESISKEKLQKQIEKQFELQEKLRIETEEFDAKKAEADDLIKRKQKSYFNEEKAKESLEKFKDAIETELENVSETIEKITNESGDSIRAFVDSQKGNPFFDSLTGGEKGKDLLNKRLKEFKSNLFDLSKESEKYRQESLKENDLTQQEILEQERQFSIAELELKKKSYIEKETLRKDNYIKELDEKKKQAEEDNKWTEEDEENYQRLLLEADETLKEELLEAEAEFLDAKIMLNKAFDNESKIIKQKQFNDDINAYVSVKKAQREFEKQGKLAMATTEAERINIKEQYRLEDFQFEKEHLQKEINQRRENGESWLSLQAELNLLEIENERTTVEAKMAIRQAEAEQAAADIDKAKQYVQGLSDVIDANFQAQIDKEENKTTIINNELRTRLDNENLSKEEKEDINKQIAANEEKLRIKQEKIEEKKFKTDKAFRISMALMDTASSALKAYASQLIPGDPTSFGRAFIAAGAATALGLAQVAAIAKQQFKSSSSAAPLRVSVDSTSASSPSTQPAEVQAPVFNVVGRSNVNQLAETIASQSKAPIKTYVVAKDVSTAQELERNIIESATL